MLGFWQEEGPKSSAFETAVAFNPVTGFCKMGLELQISETIQVAGIGSHRPTCVFCLFAFLCRLLAWALNEAGLSNYNHENHVCFFHRFFGS